MITEAIEALWQVVNARPVEWGYRRGLLVENGVIYEVIEPAPEMGRTGHGIYNVPVSPELIAEAEERLK